MIATRTIAVTGGAGFIGSAVCRRLAAQDDLRVVNIDSLTYAGNLASLAEIAASDNYVFYHQDICDRAAITEILRREHVGAILHLAAESHVDRSIDGAGVFVDTNIGGTFSMLEAARAHWSALPDDDRSDFRFVHVSTDEVYGSLEAGDASFHETTAYDPSSPYSATKAASDHLAGAWHRTYGLPVIISNCSNNYGPYHFPEKLIPLTILNALEGRPLPVYGAGDNIRDWLHVEDHAAALDLILRTGEPGRKYNIGANAERRNIDVVRTICAVLDRLRPRPDGVTYDTLIAFVDDRPGHDFRYAIDSSRLTSELGWAPARTFEEGIHSTVQWYLNREDWWRPLRDGSGVRTRPGLANWERSPMAAGSAGR